MNGVCLYGVNVRRTKIKKQVDTRDYTILQYSVLQFQLFIPQKKNHGFIFSVCGIWKEEKQKAEHRIKQNQMERTLENNMPEAILCPKQQTHTLFI